MARRSHQAVIGKAGKLAQRLDNYVAQNRRARSANWPLYAAAAGSALAMATNASASIIYCGPGNNYCASNHAPKATASENSFLAFQTQTGTGHPGAASHKIVLNLSVLQAGVSAFAGIQGANHIQIFDTSAVGSTFAKKFSSGDRIGAGMTGAHAGNSAAIQVAGVATGNPFLYGNFVSGMTGFVGLAVQAAGPSHNQTEYGWIRLYFSNASTVPGLLQVVDWAINTTPGQSINAGQQADPVGTPEPGTLPLMVLAAGAAGVAGLRRRRAVAQAAV